MKYEKPKKCPGIDSANYPMCPKDCSLSEFFNEDASQVYLTEKEKQHIAVYRSLSASQQAAVDQVMDTLIPATTNQSD
ncbi:MAG: hypothetical protein IJZ85_03495 [Lachnospiraceae bacterium]|nr:hypothetical protein [Lachnospiraceae bacterium]